MQKKKKERKYIVIKNMIIVKEKIKILILIKKKNYLNWKKFTAKDKNNITKLIEEIEFNQLLISEEVMAKLREFIK